MIKMYFLKMQLVGVQSDILSNVAQNVHLCTFTNYPVTLSCILFLSLQVEIIAFLSVNVCILKYVTCQSNPGLNESF